MFEYSFRSISGIIVWAEKAVFKLPSGQTMLAIDFIIGLLKEISLNYDEDISENRYLLDEYPPSNYIEFKSFQKREIWRIGSFIIFALNLDLILKKEFENILSFLKNFRPNDSLLFNNLKTKRENEIKPYKYYRNKIFAHTAFGSPYSDDNFSLQQTSLAYLGGLMGGSIKKDGLSFGNAYIVGKGEETPKFEEINFKDMLTTFENHYLSWRKMFSDIGFHIEKLSDEEIKKNIENNVKNIDRISQLES